MRLIQPLLIGASYICLFRSKIISSIGSSLSVSASSSYTTAKNMSESSVEKQSNDDNKYDSGTASVAFVTTPNETTAKKLAHLLVENKLAACVNVIPNLTSIYIWEGKMNEDQEYLMMIKTRTNRVDELTKLIRENHPYSVAEVITLPIENGNPPYLDWIMKSVPNKI